MKIVHHALMSLMLLLCHSLDAQKEYNIWYFGNKAGLNFNTKPVSVINSNPMYSHEGSTAMCDSAGNLLFYSNGDGIYNRNNRLMLNYKNPRQYSLFSSSVQSCVAVRHPAKNQIYYVFVTTSNENLIKFKDSSLYYYMIDMKGDRGLGEVVLNEGIVMKAGVENVAIAQDSSKKEIWILTADGFTNTLKFAKTKNGEMTGTHITHPLNYKARNGSNVRISPDGKVFAGPVSESVLLSKGYVNYHLFKFNNVSGNISGQVNITIQGVMGGYFEFSPNSRFLYASVVEPGGAGLYQFDLSVWNEKVIQNSKIKIAFMSDPIYGYQIGPDHKLYCFASSNIQELSVIENPDLKGLRCNYKFKSISLAPGGIVIGGPLFPSFKMRSKVIDLGADTILCNKDSIRLFSYAKPGEKTIWNTGDTSVYLWVKKPGQYYVTVTSPDGFQHFGSINVKYGSKPKVYIGNDTTFCKSFSHLLKAQKYYKNYKWSTADSVYSITVAKEGTYSVLVKDSSNCISGDTIKLSRLKKPEIKLTYDSVNCQYTRLYVDTIPEVYFVWNTRDTSQFIRVESKGKYIVNAHSPFCFSSDTIELDRLSQPDPQLSKDTLMCLDPIELSARDSGDFLWSNGSKTGKIKIDKPGMYWLKTERNHCSTIDTVNVIQDLPLFDLGNDTSLCSGDLEIGAGVIGSYLWNTGDTSRRIRVSKGRYVLTVRRSLCSISDSVIISQLLVPIVNLGNDTDLCLNRLELDTKVKGVYLWSTGETSPGIIIDQPGSYSLTVSNGLCSGSDTIVVRECKSLVFYVPNSFTPDANSINDKFRVYGDGIKNIEMQIYNRWGELIRNDSGADPFWDGTYKETECQEGTYFYKIKIEGFKPDDVKQLFGSLLLLR